MYEKYLPVGLPNGRKILTSQEGKTKLDENLVLNDVLYVPRLTCNVISVS